MHDKPAIRAARIYVLNTSWDKILNTIMNTTSKYWKKKKGVVKGGGGKKSGGNKGGKKGRK